MRDQKLAIEMDPEILRCFNASTNVSTSKGVGAHLLKPGSKRRRRQADIVGQNSEAEMVEIQAAEQSMRIQALEQELS